MTADGVNSMGIPGSAALARATAVLAICAALFGCEVDSDSDLYVRDIMGVAEGRVAAVDLTADFRVKFGSLEACERLKPVMTGILRKFYKSIERESCTVVAEKAPFGFERSDYFAFEAKIPLVGGRPNEQPALPDDSMMGLVAGKDADRVTLGVAMNVAGFRLMQTELSAAADHRDRVPVTFSSITLRLHNDLGKPVRVRGHASFVDSKPEMVVDLALDRLDSVAIGLSDVARGAVSTIGYAAVVELSD
ncbi:MAG: hypothetical protein HY246_01360 [Proteobacteria bacterium]|nr:hypothetical protein [Pseudomonadota bacterium]